MAARQTNGKPRSMVEQALAQMLLNQAQLLAQQTQLAALYAQLATQHSMYEKESARLQKENTERFERIEALLLRHERMLTELPEAVRKKIGYQRP